MHVLTSVGTEPPDEPTQPNTKGGELDEIAGLWRQQFKSTLDPLWDFFFFFFFFFFLGFDCRQRQTDSK